MKFYSVLVSLLAIVPLAGCGQATDKEPVDDVAIETEAEAAGETMGNCPEADVSGSIEIAPGLTARIIKAGHGRAAVSGDYADTNVRLWLYDESAEDRHGEFIWESGNDVFQFQLGSGQVIQGWDMGVPCMLEGETRELVIAGDLAYGPSGRGNIPPNATLIFTIELVKLTTPQ
ncbi:MAG: FKBP-type peptidyl-prolyl cis-trans isomerase [Gemmatimonadota bacterium]